MKTNRLIITVALIITGSFFMTISAQDALKAIAKKCESIENAAISVARSRDKETKKVNKYIMSVTFEKNESLKKEILAAFEKDRGNADHEVEDRQNGRIREMMLRFGTSSYSISEHPNGRISFSVIENYGSKDGAFLYDGFHFFDTQALQSQLDIAKQNLESIDWKEFSNDLNIDFANFSNKFDIDVKNFEKDVKKIVIEKENIEKERKNYEK